MDRHERLSYHAPRVAAEPGPVRAELKLHGNARADADCEIDSKDPDPEAGSIVPALPVWPEAPRLHEDDQEGQVHGELGEQIVIDDGERELEAVNEKITHLACPSSIRARRKRPSAQRRACVQRRAPLLPEQAQRHSLGAARTSDARKERAVLLTLSVLWPQIHHLPQDCELSEVIGVVAQGEKRTPN